MKRGTYTAAHCDLYWKVYKVHNISENNNYVKLRALFFYKSNNNICYWNNPTGRPKNFKLRLDVAKHWEPYDIK